MSEVEIKVGQIWKRKDPRDGGVQVVVERVGNFVHVNGKRRSSIRRERFPKDYRLVKDV